MKNRKTMKLRLIVMLAVLVVIAIGYFTVAGIGNVCGVGFGDIALLCPLGALMAMLAERAAIPQALVSVVVVFIFCVVVGKVFCSWVCPVHFLEKLRPKSRRGIKSAKADAQKTQSSELTAEERKALSGCATCASPCAKSKGMHFDSRHGVLLGALASTAIFGFPVFCLVCPVGLTFATVLLVMRLFTFGDTTWTIIVFPLIIAAEVFLLPRWCGKFCPLGALFSLFSGANKTFRPTVDATKCIEESGKGSCDLCVKVCPEEINLHNIAAGATTLNDCSKCRDCADVCPTGAISFPLLAKKTETATPAAAIAEGE